MRNKNNIEDSIFFRQNMKIKNNLWKAFTLLLITSFMVVAIKGIA